MSSGPWQTSGKWVDVVDRSSAGAVSPVPAREDSLALANPLPLVVHFGDEYVAPARVPSMRKLGWIAKALGLRADIRMVRPEAIEPERLFRLHDPAYVDAFLRGTAPLANSQNLPWSPALRTAVLASLGGQLAAASAALRAGVAANLAHGFHHARYERGGGYCTFNGLALVAQEFPELRVAVLDCDEHAGNGTAEYAARLPNLFSVSIHGATDRFECAESERSVALPVAPTNGSFAPYGVALSMAFEFVEKAEPDLLIYQAGVDCHASDPLGSMGLSDNALATRDSEVFRWAREREIPIMFIVAGGYTEERMLTRLHLQTFEACVNAYS